jgi:hypothetical protein
MTPAIVEPAHEGPMSQCEWGLVMRVEWLARLMWVATATEKRNKNAMIKCLYAKFVWNTIYCETYCNLASASCKKDKSSY